MQSRFARWFAPALVAVSAAWVTAAEVQVTFLRDGDFVRVARPLPAGADALETIIRAIVDGPTVEEAGQGLYSELPPGTRIEQLAITEDEVAIDFSSHVLTGLDDHQLESIFGQIKAGIVEYDAISTIRLSSGGQLLSSYLPVSTPIAPADESVVRSLAEMAMAQLGVADDTFSPMAVNALAGRKVTIGPSHGRFWNGSGWYWQRSDPCGLGEAVLEDTNSIRLMQFLYQYLAQDGATVTVPRNLTESTCCHPDTGLAWWKMCAYSWLKHSGLPCSVYANSTGNCSAETATGRVNDDIRARPKYADYVGSDIYIAHHTNAGGAGTARGTETYRDTQMENPAHEAASLNLANAVQNGMINNIRDMWDSCWVSRGVKDSAGGFGEIRIPNRPAVLIELAFHDGCNPSTVGCGAKDTDALINNYFRSVAMYGLYKGICDYFGVSPGWAKYSDEYVSDTIPTSMTAGQPYNVSITYRNRGVLWSNAYNFRLGAVGDSDPFTSFTRVNISGEVRPGNTYTFNFTMVAPTAGTFTTDWRMVRDGVAWFGDTVSKVVNVDSGTPDTEPPTVTITSPTSAATFATSSPTLNIGGTAADDRILAAVTWENDRGGSGAASGLASWTVNGIALQTGVNVITVTAKDSADNTGTDTLTVTYTPDTQAPDTPTNLEAVATGSNSVQLSWTASTDNVAVTGYDIRRNGAVIASSGTTSHTDNTVAAGTTYTYEVRAKDAVPNYSAYSSPAVVTTPAASVLVFTDGFNNNLNNWVQVASKEYAYSTAQNHGTYTGAGAAYMAAGESDQMYHSFSRPFAQGKVSGWFWDEQGGWKVNVCGKGYRQSLSLRDNVTGVLMIIDNCMASNVGAGNYYWRTVGGGGITYTQFGTRNPNTSCSAAWIYFETTVSPGTPGASPTGTFVAKVTDGAGTIATTQNLTTDFYTTGNGIGRITLGLGVSSAGTGYWDDIAFTATPPNSPSMNAPSNISTTSIRWNYTPSDAVFFGCDLADENGVVKSPNYPASGWLDRAKTFYAETGLVPNTEYQRKLRAWNGTLNSSWSDTVSACTLSVAPTTGSITPDAPNGCPGTEVEWTAVGGFGPGTVQYYRYAWDQSPTYTFDDTEQTWSGETLFTMPTAAGTWYLHVKGYNAFDAANGTHHYAFNVPDTDGDGAADCQDNCLTASNADQINTDGDSLGDACDPCPAIPEECPERSIVGWKSIRTHAGDGELAIPLDGAVLKTEPRHGGIQAIEVDFNEGVTLLNTAAITVSGKTTTDGSAGPAVPYVPAAVVQVDADTLRIVFAPGQLPDQTCYTVTLEPGTVAELLTGDRDLVVRSLLGDVDMNGEVTTADIGAVKAKLLAATGAPASPESDLNLGGGAINLGDALFVRSRLQDPATTVICP